MADIYMYQDIKLKYHKDWTHSAYLEPTLHFDTKTLKKTWAMWIQKQLTLNSIDKTTRSKMY